MVRLDILGDVDLRADDGTVVSSLVSQPRRFALLVFLAMEGGGGGVERDRLLGVFWPDLPQDRGRQALRTALHFLRRSLGPDVLVTRGDLLVVDPTALSCDVVELIAAIESERLEDALRLYRGDLLPGFFLDGGPVEFEHWLEDARARLRREVAAAAWRLALAAENEGRLPAAGAWARRATGLWQNDEAATRRAIELLTRIGDRAGALAAYDDLARRLRDEFDAEPSDETRAVAARARSAPGGAPAAATAEVEPDEEVTEAAAGADPVSPPAVPTAPARRRWASPVRRQLLSGAVTLLLIAAFYSLWGLTRSAPATVDTGGMIQPVIEVEPVKDFSFGGGKADLAGALTLELASQLASTPGLTVVPLTAQRSQPAKTWDGPGFIVRAGLMRIDSTARVTAMLLDAASGATLHRIVVERRLSDPGAEVSELSASLVPLVRREVGRAVADYQRRAQAHDLRALELLRGGVRDQATAESLFVAGSLQTAALVYEAADSQFMLAQAAAPTWSEPSVRRAELALRSMWIYLGPAHPDTAALVTTLRRGESAASHAVDVDPNDPAALEMRGRLRYWSWLTRSGGSAAADQQALAGAGVDLRRATHLDAGRPYAWATLSAILEGRGDFAAANVAALRAYRADAFLAATNEILVRLFATALEIGDMDAARHWCQELHGRFDGDWPATYCDVAWRAWNGLGGMAPDSALRLVDRATRNNPETTAIRPRLQLLAAVAMARSGFEREAREVLTAVGPVADRDPNNRVLEAWACLLLGERQRALDLLASAIHENPRRRDKVLRSRRFDPLRAEPAFQRLTGAAAATHPLDAGLRSVP